MRTSPASRGSLHPSAGTVAELDALSRPRIPLGPRQCPTTPACLRLRTPPPRPGLHPEPQGGRTVGAGVQRGDMVVPCGKRQQAAHHLLPAFHAQGARDGLAAHTDSPTQGSQFIPQEAPGIEGVRGPRRHRRHVLRTQSQPGPEGQAQATGHSNPAPDPAHGRRSHSGLSENPTGLSSHGLRVVMPDHGMPARIHPNCARKAVPPARRISRATNTPDDPAPMLHASRHP